MILRNRLSRLDFVFFILALSFMSTTLVGQSKPARAPKKSKINALQPPAPLPDGAPQLPVHERFATFRAGEFKSVFLLQNFRSNATVEITPSLILKEGEFPMEPVTLKPHTATTVDINAFLQAHGFTDTRGTAVMRYTFSPYDAVNGVVLASDEVHRLFVNSYAQSPEEYWQGTSYDAALWAPDDDTKGTISIINTSKEPRTVNVTFLVKGRSEKLPPITIPARHTHTLNINELVERSRENGAGIHVEYSEYPGSILVEGHLVNPRNGFEKYIHFLDKTLRYPTGTVRTQFLLLGRQPDEDGFPTGMSFRSVAVVRNIDPVPVRVTPILKFQRNGAPETVSLEPLSLGVGESRVIDLAEQQNAGFVPGDFHQGSLKLDPNTDHASIVAELFNFDDLTGGFTIGPMFFSYPGRATQSVWRTDGTFQTTIMVENTADKDDSVTVDLFSDSGTYSKTFPIPAGNLLKINLKQLQQDNVPDDHGHAFGDTYGVLSVAGKNGHLSQLSFDKLIHSAIDSDYVGLPGGPGACVGVQDVFMFLSGSQNPFEVWEQQDFTDGSSEQWHTSGSWTNSPNMMQIWGTSSGDMANLIPIDSQSHTVAFFGQQTPVMDCPACSVDDTTPRGGATVPPMNDFTVNAQSITDGDTGSFAISVINGTPSSYQWSFTVPVQGAGNNPKVNFTNASGAQTNTDGHWYAFPNASCPPADQTGAPGRNAMYTITATVNFSSGNSPVTHNTTLSANFIWFDLARTGQASITGVPATAQDSQNVWHFTGLGSMTRVLPVPNILVTPTSQFRNKTVQHEQVHVQQWMPGGLVGDLYIPQDLFNIVANFTSTISQADLLNQYATALNNYNNTEINIFAMRKKQLEHDAFVVSDPIAPQYMVQNCGRF